MVCNYHKSIGTKASYHQRKFWGKFYKNISFAEGTIKAYQVVFLIAGLLFFIVGLLSIFHIIKFK